MEGSEWTKDWLDGVVGTFDWKYEGNQDEDV